MPELGTAWITLTVSARNARRDIQRELDGVDGGAAGRRAGQRFSAGAVGATNLSGVEQKLLAVGQRGGEAAGKALAFGLKAGAAAGVAAFATTAKLGADRLLAIDDARGKLKGLGHDAAAQAKIMDSALASVKGTAFGLGDAATISASAVAAGIKPGAELTKYLKSTADAATIAGSSLSEMGSIFNKVQTGQTAMTDDLNMLADRGVPIYQWIAKEMKISAGEVKKYAEKGKIDSAVFFKAINDNIGGAALESGKTVRGSFNNMKAAVGRFGAALDEPSFKRAPATFTAITKAIDEATPAAGRFAQSLDAKMFDEWVPAAQRAWRELSANPAVRSNMAEVGQIVSSIGMTAQQVWPAIAQIGSSLGKASAALGVSTWQLFLTTLEAAAGVANMLVGPLQSIAGFMSSHQGVVTAAVGAWLLFRTVPAIMGRVSGSVSTAATAAQRFGAAATGQNLAGFRASMAGIVGDYRNIGTAAQNSGQQVSRWTQTMRALSNNSTTIRNMGNAFAGAATPVGAFSSALRAGAAPAIAGVQKAASGVIGALGGPWGAAFAAAGIAAALTISKNQKSAQSMEAVRKAAIDAASAQNELNDALIANRGSDTAAEVKSAGKARVDALRQELEAASSRTGSPLDNFRAKGESLFSWNSMIGGDGRVTQADAIEEEANKAKEAMAALDALKLTQQSLSDVTYGSATAFQQMVSKLDAAGEGGKQAADKLREARARFQETQELARRGTPGIGEMAKAMQTLGDRTASAADKTNALRAAIDALNPARSKGEAFAEHDKVLRQISESTQEALDRTKGFGKELLSAETGISTATANGDALRQKLLDLSNASLTAAAAGKPLAEIHAQNAAKLKELAAQSGITVDEITGAFDKLGGRDIEMTARLSGAPETVQQIGQIARAMQDAKIGEKKFIPIAVDDKAIAALKTIDIEVTRLPDNKGIEVVAKTETARAQLANVTQVLTALPAGKAVDVSAPGGQAVVDLLRAANIEVTSHNGKDIEVTSPNAPGVKALLEALNLEVRSHNGKNILVTSSGGPETLTMLNGLKATIEQIPNEKRVRVTVSADPNFRPDINQIPISPGSINANGSITSYANGGIDGRLPSQAVMKRGRGRGLVQWAEGETGIESFIPWATGKRRRSTMILSETARAFGYQLVRPGEFFQKFENGGISVDRLKQFASGIQGHNYVWGGGGSTFDADCSGAQATIANFLTGASGRFSTANQAEALAARGFIMGDPPEGTAAYAIGWVNGGPGGGHTSGTIIDPVGGNVNVEMGGAGGNGQYGGQAAAASSFPNRAYLPLQGQDMNSSGGSGASDDSSSSGGSGGGSGSGFGSLGTSIGQALFGSRSGGGTGGSGTSSKTTAATARQLRDAQDKATDAEKAAVVAKQKVAELEANPKTKASALQAAKDRAEKTEREAAQAKTDLEELKNKGTGTGTKNSTDGSSMSEFQSAGQGFVSGMLQAVGLDGSVFSNPLEWPNFKSGTALANYLGSLAKTVAGNGSSQDVGGLVGGAGAGLGLNIPNLADLAKPQTPQAPVGPGGALPLQGGGVTYDFRGANLGVNPKEMTQRIDSRQNAAFRRQSGALV
ncbi:tape measure protein [Tsukamurella tyrosinosolvens]|uniref:tape measure protein n=1 Tax=Tsukamurella tyrosinosolvens TaxID=57704 RepID=UPI003F4A2EE6